MVHRTDDVRHDWPLRLGAEGTDAVVESHRIGCSHFDAFRFFTPTARPLNTLQPGRDDRPAFEQPGCLHAGMDLYKHAFRLSPMVPSDLVADCFELARDIRVLDMRAAPYDLADLGFEPVRIETAEGKAAYVEAQRGFAERGAPLRARLIERVRAAAGALSCARASELVAEGLDRVGEDVGHALLRRRRVELAVVPGRSGVALGARQVGRAGQAELRPTPRRARRRATRSAAPGRAPSGRGSGRAGGCWRAARSRSPGRRPRSRAARRGPCTSRSRARRPRPTGSARSRR